MEISNKSNISAQYFTNDACLVKKQTGTRGVNIPIVITCGVYCYHPLVGLRYSLFTVYFNLFLSSSLWKRVQSYPDAGETAFHSDINM